MASSLTNAQPRERHLVKEYDINGILNGTLAVPLSSLPGAKRILAAYATSKVSTVAEAQAQQAVSALIATDGQSVTFYGWQEDGTASATDRPFNAVVVCQTEPN